MAGRRIVLSDAFKGYSGELDKNSYVRSLIKVKDNVRAVCKKPRLTKNQRKEMANRPQIKRFNWVTEEAQKIYHDPELRAKWETIHAKFRKEARKKGEYDYPRLWDFIRHTLNLAKIEADKKKNSL